MNPAQAMGTFLRTWRSEWARMSRAQLATAISALCRNGKRVTPFIIQEWEDGQPPKTTAELDGLCAVMARNGLCEPLVTFCGDVLAVLAEGGELGPVLDAHADAAQHEQRRLLRQQGQDNTQQMVYVVAATTLLVIFVLAGGPALWTLMQSL